MIKIKLGQVMRYIVQWGVLVLALWIGYMHSLYGGGTTGYAPVDAFCPFGGLETLYSWLSEGLLLRRTSMADLILLAAFIGITFLVGRTFCGAICPLGAIQEWFAKAGRALGIKKKELPISIDRTLRYLKYLALIGIVYFVWKSGTLFWRDYDPWVVTMHTFDPSALIEEKTVGLVILIAVLVAGLFIERAWCRYLCPLGAFLSIPHIFSPMRVTRQESSCIKCGNCDRSCPVRLDISNKDVVRSPECIQCGACTDSCPVKDTLEMGTGSLRVKYWKILALTIAVFLCVYAVANITGVWSTFDVKTDVPHKASNVISGDALSTVAPSNSEVVKKEPINPQEIKGMYTLKEILEMYSLSADALLEKAGWPKDVSPDLTLKEIAGKYPDKNLEVQQIRDAVTEMIK